MSIRGIFCAAFAVLVALSVPLYGAFLPGSPALRWLGEPIQLWVSAGFALILLCWLAAFVAYESRQRRLAVELAERQRDTAQQRAIHLQHQMDAQRAADEAKVGELKQQVADRKLALETDRSEFAERKDAWRSKLRQAEALIARRQAACDERERRQHDESEQLTADQASWEEQWRQREADLAVQSEQLADQKTRLDADQQREQQRLTDLASHLHEGKTRLAGQQGALETQRMQWIHERTTDENRLADWRASLESRAQELEIKLATTSKRFAAQAQMLADNEDQLARARETWEKRRVDEEQRLSSWEDRLQRQALELDRRLEQNDLESAQLRSRLEQREAAISEREELLDLRRQQWEDQKRRWEEAVGIAVQPEDAGESADTPGDPADHPVAQTMGDVGGGGEGECESSRVIHDEPNDKDPEPLEYAQIDDSVDDLSDEVWDESELVDTPIVHRLAMLGRRRSGHR